MIDWINHAKHRDYVAQKEGQWIGILDGSGNPVFDLPHPIDMSASEARLSPESLKVSIPIEGENGVLHPVTDLLLGSHLGIIDNGTFQPANGSTYIIVVQRANGEQWAGKIKFATAQGGALKPTVLTIHALNVLDVLGELPCPASNEAWRNAPYQTMRNDPAVAFEKSREISLLTLANSADGFSEKGEAEPLIRRIITEAIGTVSKHSGWKQPHVVVDQTPSGESTPSITVRLTDSSIWDTVVEYALLAGVNIRARLVFPNTELINGKSYEHPVICVSVKKAGANG